ncbi:hypothetical protein PR048_006948 [Dryococelus australis]|uniref:Uncharacterized protein n=1 Tax=Dryococelus australis TaxID=614101 RepID=A0ABQ9ICC3_9NEOP|nr:hypothetical protein PR048_006948 [Dryococelus australis]
MLCHSCPRRPSCPLRLISVTLTLTPVKVHRNKVKVTKMAAEVTGMKERAIEAARLDCSPHTKANRVQSAAGSLRIFAIGNHAGQCRWSAGFLGDLPFLPPLDSGAAPYPPHFTRIDSQDLDSGIPAFLLATKVHLQAKTGMTRGDSTTAWEADTAFGKPVVGKAREFPTFVDLGALRLSGYHLSLVRVPPVRNVLSSPSASQTLALLDPTMKQGGTPKMI